VLGRTADSSLADNPEELMGPHVFLAVWSVLERVEPVVTAVALLWPR
jgi:hypothetical protein